MERAGGNAPPFVATVKRCLYKDFELTQRQLRDPLLLSIAALLMGSRRGNVQRVVTLNYDCVLEWFLQLCGLMPQVVVKPTDLERTADVRIYHAHGFLATTPLEIADSDFLVLGAHSVNARLADKSDDWYALVLHILQRGVALFVGLSHRTFRDRALAPLLLAASKHRELGVPIGFWIRPGRLKGVERREYLESGVVPLETPKRAVPALLLDICRESAKSAYF
jgi:hypothetical protein